MCYSVTLCQKVKKINCQKVVKKVVKKLSKVVKKLSKNCQKVFKKLSKSCQKVVKKLSESCKKLSSKNITKNVRKRAKIAKIAKSR
jgi:uncharacterized membrane-anchored protein YhcB (DUF1043 family)